MLIHRAIISLEIRFETNWEGRPLVFDNNWKALGMGEMQLLSVN